MKNTYKRAGAFNIVCAILYMASCIVSVSFLQLELMLSVSDGADGLRVLFLVVYWTMLLGFPFCMTVTGGAMLFTRRKGAGTRLLIIFTNFLKVCGIIYNLYFGCVYLGMGLENTVIGGIVLFSVAAVMSASVVVDIQALVKNQKQNQK